MRILVLLLLLLSCKIFADSIVIPSDKVIDKDYFGVSENAEISGRIEGDLYLCTGQIFIDGVVAKDVLIIGGSIDINGEVLGNIRVIGGQVTISGKVGGNVTVIAGDVRVNPTATIGGNITGVAGSCELGADVGRDVKFYASSLRISGVIKRNVEAAVAKLRITSKAQIGGDVAYWSDEDAYVDEGAVVSGEIVHHRPFFHDLTPGKWLQKLKIGSKVLALSMNFLYTLIFGIVLLKFFPNAVDPFVAALKKNPLRSLLYGLITCIILPILALILLMTVLGAPFALTLIALNIIGFYTAKIIFILWGIDAACKRWKWKKRRYLYFFFGLLIFFALTLIPILGFFISIGALLFGIGALVSSKGPFKAQKSA